MTTVLRITDGTTTADLIFNSITNRKYQLCEGGWAPAVAGLRRSTLGGAGPYEDVTEEISINVWGDSPAEALANLAVLSQLLDQAERWARGEAAKAVRVEYQPEGASQLLSAVILGRDDQDAGGLALPTGFSQGLFGYAIEDVRLRFVRRGSWLAPEESAGPGTAAYAPTVQTVTLPSVAALPSPLGLQISGVAVDATVPTLPAGYLAVADQESDIVILEAEACATSVPGGSAAAVVADVVGQARGGSVLRFTCGATGRHRLTQKDLPVVVIGLTAAARSVAILAAVRNNSATVTYQASAGVGGYADVVASSYAQTIDASTTNPRLLLFGPLRLNQPLHSFVLDFYPSATGGTLDVDYVALIALDGDNRLIGLPNAPVGGSPTGPAYLAVNPAEGSALAPTLEVRAAGSGISVQWPAYQGDVALSVAGDTVAACLFGTRGTAWRFTDTGNNVIQTRLTALRRPAYLTPQ